jgi:hypothetical protein
MTAPLPLPADDGAELVGLLQTVAELCDHFPVHVGDMLGSLLGTGYGAGDLGADAARLAGGLASAMGLDTSREGTR